MTDTTKTEALDRFEKAVARKAVLFLTYMGKAMPDEVYSEFATLRDDTIPSLRKLLSAVGADRDRLAAECEALRADAERYRWLANCGAVIAPSLWDKGIAFPVEIRRVDRGSLFCKEQIDAAIDAARAKNSPNPAQKGASS